MVKNNLSWYAKFHQHAKDNLGDKNAGPRASILKRTIKVKFLDNVIGEVRGRRMADCNEAAMDCDGW